MPYNNPRERSFGCVATRRTTYLFAGSDAGGRRAAARDSLIETAKVDGTVCKRASLVSSTASPTTRQNGRRAPALGLETPLSMPTP